MDLVREKKQKFVRRLGKSWIESIGTVEFLEIFPTKILAANTESPLDWTGCSRRLKKRSFWKMIVYPHYRSSFFVKRYLNTIVMMSVSALSAAIISNLAAHEPMTATIFPDTLIVEVGHLGKEHGTTLI